MRGKCQVYINIDQALLLSDGIHATELYNMSQYKSKTTVCQWLICTTTLFLVEFIQPKWDR